MGRPRWYAGILAVAAAILPMAPSTAATGKPIVVTYTAMAGVPTHVAKNGTLSFSLTFTQQSAYRLNLDGLSFEVWNRCLCAPDDTEGTVATYLDPTTGTWRTTPPAAGDAYLLEMQTHLAVAPGQKVTIPVRLKMTPFHDGSYTVADNGTIVGAALDAQGGFIPFTWQYHEAGDKHFTLGSATATTTHRSPAPKPKTTHSPAATRQPSPAAVASVAAPVVSASPSLTSADDSPVPSALAPQLAPVAQAEPSHAAWWLSGALAILAFTVAGVYAIRRRRSLAAPPDAS